MNIKYFNFNRLISNKMNKKFNIDIKADFIAN